MKFAKLGFETKEGLSLAHFQDGWSMEYGEGGSYQCDLLYKGKKVCTLMEEGNGGPLNIYGEADKATMKEVEKAIITYLARTNEDYGPNSKYDFCKEAVAKCEASECEYSTLANDLIDEYETRKKMAKWFKQGYKVVGKFDFGYGNTMVASGNDSRDNLLDYAKKKNIKGELTCYHADYLENKTI